MLNYILRRILATIPVMAVVTLFVFSLLYIAPGDPAAVIAGDQASPADVARIRASLGLDRPFLVRFGEWSWQILHGELGTSIFTNLPVATMIAQRFEPTLSLMAVTLAFAVMVAVPIGVVAASRADTIIDRAIMAFAVLGFSVPVFVIGYVLAYVFAVELDWLPVQGYTPLAEGVAPWIEHLILPALALGCVFIAVIARTTRAAMLEVLQQDYIRTARATGGQPAPPLVRACAQERRGADCHRYRHWHGTADRRHPGHRDRVRDPWRRPPDRRCHPAPRLSGNPRRRAPVQLRLRRRQFAGRPDLHGPRPEDPVLNPPTVIPATAPDAFVTTTAMVGVVAAPDLPDLLPPVAPRRHLVGWAQRHPAIAIGGALVLAMLLIALFAPFLGTVDPTALAPARRTREPSGAFWFGTDMLGRDVYSRVLYGTRVSLTVGFSVATLASLAGLSIGLISGFIRWLDGLIMRVADGLMSIPGILLAVALMALTRGSVANVITAITIVETPRVSRLVRSVVLSPREQPFVDAAIAAGTHTPMIILRHILPNTLAPITVQATYVCASAMLGEAILCFIGAGTPPTVPSWGNMMAERRALWQVKPYIVFFPAAFLSVTVLAVNLLGDGLGDALDPRMAKRL
jgi:peptide/nickel transport system permease protein